MLPMCPSEYSVKLLERTPPRLPFVLSWNYCSFEVFPQQSTAVMGSRSRFAVGLFLSFAVFHLLW
jgi:hypothetical protein